MRSKLAIDFIMTFKGYLLFNVEIMAWLVQDSATKK